jgi:DNA replicative helicase MCM subunit Mcm2 (Cdc46/Mcm family)
VLFLLSQRSHILAIKEIINSLEAEGNKSIKISEIIKKAQEKNIKAEVVDETVEKLKRSGDIFEPRRGEIQKI